MLPRESNSKEVDSGLLSIIGFPAFAVDDAILIKSTRDTILTKLCGKYGCKRFLRDGYKTAKEVQQQRGVMFQSNVGNENIFQDGNRLYYEPWELRMFDNIECEWPLFFCYLIMDYFFHGNKDLAAEYTKQLEKVLQQRN